jgi:predicted dienelactone hydrolase
MSTWWMTLPVRPCIRKHRVVERHSLIVRRSGADWDDPTARRTSLGRWRMRWRGYGLDAGLEEGRVSRVRQNALRPWFLALVLMLYGSDVAMGAAVARNVGFEELQIPNGEEPPLVIGIWYPTAAPAQKHELEPFKQDVALDAPVAGAHLALVVISHGGGASYASHYDTALALAHAGLVAAAVSHAGDDSDDQSQVLKLWRRPAQLRRLISYMLGEWPAHDRLDAERIGAFGFSNGGFTVLVAAGGIPDLRKIDPYCRANPGHDLCLALKQAGVGSVVALPIPSGAWTPDPRIRAVVSAAPAFGFTFDRAGLRNVQVPVQLWRAADDRHQPNPWYEEVVRNALPRVPDYHVVAHAGHYDFLPPCSARLAEAAPQICVDPLGFDRTAFHRVFNAQVVRFFQSALHERPAGRDRSTSL